MIDKIALFHQLEELLSQKAKAANVTDLEKYYTPEGLLKNQSHYFRLASSLQNGTSSGMDRSIRFNGENQKMICQVLHGCDHLEVCRHYGSWQELYNEFMKHIPDAGAKSREARKQKAEAKNKAFTSRPTNWEKYASGLYTGAIFLRDNPGIIDQLCAYNDKTQLDMKQVSTLLEKFTEISNLGPALRCDWLKECGCTWLVKPDVHIKTVYHAMVEKETDTEINYNKIKDANIIAYYFDWSQTLKKAGMEITAYQLDKMVWLICTGEFYLDKDTHIGRNTILQAING